MAAVLGRCRASKDREHSLLSLLRKQEGFWETGRSERRTVVAAETGRTPNWDAAKSESEPLTGERPRGNRFRVQRAELLRKIPENLPGPTREWRARQAERILKEREARWNKHLAPVFGDRKAALVTAQELLKYQADRVASGDARHATINRELQLLRRAFRLGFEARPKLVPDIPKLPARLAESPRKGFIEDLAFAKLLAAIEEPGLRGLVLTAFRLGFRKSELQNLLCLQLADGWLRLFAGATKNGKARAVKLPSDVNEALMVCAKGKALDDFLFTWPDGSAIKDFRGAWAKATKAAGVPKRYSRPATLGSSAHSKEGRPDFYRYAYYRAPDPAGVR